MERNAETTLKNWYNRDRRKPLIIRGARQVGKSTLVHRAAQALGVPLWEINLERHAALNEVFGTFDIKRICAEIGIASGISAVGEGRGILFLDEIQSTPKALSALRYFYEDRPDMAVIAAGSLLEFTLADFSSAMPVGRIEYLHLGPVNFGEYLRAAASKPVFEAWASWQPGVEISSMLHDQLTSQLRQFMMCGGMPEAASDCAIHTDAVSVRDIHRSILETYRDDFGKYAGRIDHARVRRVFDYLPSGVGKKFRCSSVNPDWKAVDTRRILDLLVHAGIASRICHSDGTGIPLSANADDSVYKPLFLDVGLMQTALGLPPLSMEEFRSARFINEGALAEQFVGQELLFRDRNRARPLLHYWMREGKSTNAELDYLIQSGASVYPVEVKSGTAGGMRSLHQFMSQRQAPCAIRFDLNVPSEQMVDTVIMTAEGKKPVHYRLISLPLYFAGRIDEIIASL